MGLWWRELKTIIVVLNQIAPLQVVLVDPQQLVRLPEGCWLIVPAVQITWLCDVLLFGLSSMKTDEGLDETVG